MTEGHKHRTIRVRNNGLLRKALTRPTLAYTDTATAERSRFAWGPTRCPDVWRLSPLGLLHGLTGLTLWVDK